MPIQWFPGHMTRTKKLILENLKKVDVVMEILDARAPMASRNPLLEELTRGKPRLILLNKSDLADSGITSSWIYYMNKGNDVKSLAVNSRNKKSLKAVPGACKVLCAGKRWLNRRPVRAMVVGIPNVGKSTIINTLSGKKKAAAANIPGVTRDTQRVPVSRELQILDTPGILWHKFDDPLTGLKLAVLGSIKDSILLMDEIALEALEYMKTHYPGALIARYKLDIHGPEGKAEDLAEFENHEILENIAIKRGLVLEGALPDMERAARLFLKELRDGLICLLSLESPASLTRGWNMSCFTPEGQ